MLLQKQFCKTCHNECTIMHLLTIVSGLMEPKLLTYSLHSTSVATPVKMQELLGGLNTSKLSLQNLEMDSGFIKNNLVFNSKLLVSERIFAQKFFLGYFFFFRRKTILALHLKNASDICILTNRIKWGQIMQKVALIFLFFT